MNGQLLNRGLIALTVLAAILLGLIGFVLYLLSRHITPEGNVPSAEAFGLTGLLLAFREVLGRISGLWDHEATANLTNHLAASAPTPETPSKTTVEE